VGVVLREAADSGHAVEFAGLFEAVDGAEFGEADGEIAVAARLSGVNLDVVGAVHRLKEVFGFVVGVALLLSGIGFLVLALGGALESERLFWALKPKAKKSVETVVA
jgi:hypothetical protein